MIAFRRKSQVVSTMLSRMGKGLTELIMVLAILSTTIGCGWLCQGWLLGVPAINFAALNAITDSSAVYAVSILPDQKHCISVGLDGILRTYQLDAHACLEELETRHCAARCLAHSPDGNHLVSGHSTGHIQVWDFGTKGSAARCFQGHPEEVVCCAFHPSGKYFVTCAWDGKCIGWDTITLQPLWKADNPSGTITAVCFSSEGSRLITGDLNGTVHIRNSSTGAMAREFRMVNSAPVDQRSIMADRIIGVKCLPGSDNVLVTNVAGSMEVWDLECRNCLRMFARSAINIRSFQLSRDGSMAVTGNCDGTISVWDVRSGTCRKTWAGHTADVLGVDCSADNSRIASVGWDGQTKFWEI